MGAPNDGTLADSGPGDYEPEDSSSGGGMVREDAVLCRLREVEC
jgi:hypothetical protein